MKSDLTEISALFRSCWKRLFLTDLLYKLLALIILAPLSGVLFRWLLSLSGDDVLSDAEIALFLLRPTGLVFLVVNASVALALIGLEQGSLLGILCAHRGQQQLSVIGALKFAMLNAPHVLQITFLIVIQTLLVSLPFLAVAGVVYATQLTEFDINYYLAEKPPAFVRSLAIGAVLALGLAVVWLRLFTGWFFALPIGLFEQASASASLKRSKERAQGRRRLLAFWIAGWLLVTTLVGALGTLLVTQAGRLVLPELQGTLQWLVIAIGVVVLGWFVVSTATNLLSTALFSTLLFQLYGSIGSDGKAIASTPMPETPIEAQRVAWITRPRIAIACLVGLVIACVTGWSVSRSLPARDSVLIMAHRGASGAAPDNTLAAIRQAIEDGADWVEIDVQETADGEVVVFHDSDFMKLAGKPLKIWDATRDQLRDIDVGSWFSPEFADQRVPTLAELLDECKGKIKVIIELKYYGHDQQLEQRVADIVDSKGMASEVMAMSLKRDAVVKMESIRPEWNVGLLMSVHVGKLDRLQADFLAVNAGFANVPLIESAHDRGMDLYVWTVNDAPTMSVMIGRGVDGLLTDEPALAREVLKQRATLTVPQRLLLELASHFGVQSESGDQ